MTRQQLIKKLDSLFARYIVARDGGRCVICGSADHPECGHLLTRAAMSTRWSEMNAHCQCHACNRRHEEDPKPYTDWFIAKYGQSAYDGLLSLHNTVVHFTNDQLETAIAKTEQMLKQMYR